MRQDDSFLCEPVRSLQTMLRTIAANEQQSSPLIPDGIYGPETMMAVTAFQRSHAIPATGVTDLQTWEHVAEAYEDAAVNQSSAYPMEIELGNCRKLARGSTDPNMKMIQSMLGCMADAYGSIGAPEISGRYDGGTEDSVCAFQQMCGLPMTGEIDRMTWKHMAMQYPLAVRYISRRQEKL